MPDEPTPLIVEVAKLDKRVNQALDAAVRAENKADEALARAPGTPADLTSVLERLSDLEADFASTGQELHALEVSLTNLRALVRELEGSTGPEEPERPTDPPPDSGGIQDRPGRLKVDQAGLTVFDGWDKVYAFGAGLGMLRPGDVAEYQSEELRGYYSRIEPRGDTAPYSTPLLDLTSGEPDKPITVRFPRNFRHIGWELPNGQAPADFNRKSNYYPALLYLGGYHQGKLLSDWTLEGYSPRGGLGLGLKMGGVRMTARLGYGYRCGAEPFNLGGDSAAVHNGPRFDAYLPTAQQLYGQFNEDHSSTLGDSADAVVKVSHSQGALVEYVVGDGGSDDIVDGIGAHAHATRPLVWRRVFGRGAGYYHTIENGVRSRVEAPNGNGMGVKAGGASSSPGGKNAGILVTECGMVGAKHTSFTMNGAAGVVFDRCVEAGAGKQSYSLWCYATGAVRNSVGTRLPFIQDFKSGCNDGPNSDPHGKATVENYTLATEGDFLSLDLRDLTKGLFLTHRDPTKRPFGWTSEQLGKFIAIEEHFGIKIGAD